MAKAKPKTPPTKVTGTSKLTTLPIAKLMSAPWNYKLAGTDEMKAKLISSIKNSESAGVLAVRVMPGGKFEVIDGNHRLEAVQAMKWTHVPCENFGKISQAKAVVISRQRNFQWFEDDVMALGQLYRDVVLPEFDTIDLMDMLPESDTTFDEILRLAEGAGAEPPEEPQSEPPEMTTIKLTAEQWAICRQAINQVKKVEEDDTISDGRCLELVAAEYLAQ